MFPRLALIGLRIAVAVGGCVPVAAGLLGVLTGPAFIADSAYPVPVDSHIRYLSGLLLAVGVAFWTTIPHIEDRTGRFRLLTALVVTGGLARLLGIVQHGAPSASTLGALAMELGVTPLLCLWQAAVARNSRQASLPG